MYKESSKNKTISWKESKKEREKRKASSNDNQFFNYSKYRKQENLLNIGKQFIYMPGTHKQHKNTKKKSK